MSEAEPSEDNIIEFTVTASHGGERLDAYLAEASRDDASAELCEGAGLISRSAFSKLCENGGVSVNGQTAPKKQKLCAGDRITVRLPAPQPSVALPEDIPLDIVYEDGDIIVINKPSGMVVHPAAGNPSGTLVNALLAHCGDSLSGIGGVIRPGIVHRIDKDTSGLLVVAKNDASHLSLAADIKKHAVRRTYIALLCGIPSSDTGTVDAPIGRHPTDRKKMAVLRDPTYRAREAVTHYRVCERYIGASLVVCQLETGRTHQIRVHMSSIGHPVLGDPAYGGMSGSAFSANTSLIHGQCLHAARLELTHPTTHENMCFTAPCPDDMQTLIDRLRRGSGYTEPYETVEAYTAEKSFSAGKEGYDQ